MNLGRRGYLWGSVFVLLSILPVRGQGQAKDSGEAIRPDEMIKLSIDELRSSVMYPTPGEKISVKIAIRNLGQVAAKNVDLVLLANRDPIHKRQVNIEVGETLNLQIPWMPTAGTHSLALKLDPAQHLPQSDRSTNSAFVQLIVSPKLPPGADIAITDFHITEAPDRPDIASVSLRNEGKLAVGGPLEIRSGDRLISAVLVKPIPAGTVMTLQVPLPFGVGIDVLSVEFSPRYRATLKHPDAALRVRDTRKSSDLRVEELSLAATPPERGKIRRATISFRIVNHGKDAITTPFETRIFPGQVDTVRRTLAPYTLTTNELAAGKMIYVSRTIGLPDEVHEFDARVETDIGNRFHTPTAKTATLHFKNPPSDVGRWVTIGPEGVNEGSGANGVLFSVALDPSNPSIIYVGSHGSGVWKTSDGGSSWSPITDSLPSLKIAALAVDPAQPSRVLVATPDAGIFRSDDGGTSWSRISDSAPLNLSDCCNTFIFDPTTSNSFYLSSFSGVFHSLDEGATWALSLGGGFVNSLVLDASAGKLYASLQNNDPNNIGNTGIYELNLNQTTWNRMAGCPIQGPLPTVTTPTMITLSLSGSTLYAAFRTPSSYQVFRTKDETCRLGPQEFATAWEPRWNATGTVGGDPIPSLLWNSIYSDSLDPNFVYATGTYFWRSTDGAASFSIPEGGPHADDHGFAASIGSPNTTHVVCDGGIYSSSDHGTSGTFRYLGRGITNMEFYDMAQAATDPSLVIGGTQDNGTQKYDSSSAFWTWIQGGDGGTVAIDPTNSIIMYAMYQYASSITMSTDGGASWTGIGAGLPAGAVCFNIPFQVHPRNTSTLLASCGSLWRTSPPGTPWSTIFTPSNEFVLRSAVDPTVDLYYAGTTSGNVYAGPSGASWRRVFSQPSAAAVSDIQVDPTDAALVYTAFAATGPGRVFLLKRNSPAPSSVAAVDITSNLPVGLGIRTLAVDPEFAYTIYIGTNAGVFRGHSWDRGANWFWTSYNNGLPPAVIINRLSFHPTSGVLRAGSFGRSAFEVNTDSPLGGLVEVQGKITLLRVNDVGTGYGPPTDYLDVEVEVWLDSQPGRAFGFQLRNDSDEADHTEMLKLLRNAFNNNTTVQLDLIRTGVRNGRILRVMNLP
jgi:photosystem II stability/assembly factor-like uncharacterized protein